MILTRTCHTIGEVGKLLGAKWKELDDEEKKVRISPHHRHCPILTRIYSHMSSRLLKIRQEQRRIRLYMRYTLRVYTFYITC